MTRYKDADKLIHRLEDTAITPVPQWIKAEIINAPTADVVEVVRCKDCKYYETDGGALMVCEVSALNTNDNDFCSYGEREEE